LFFASLSHIVIGVGVMVSPAFREWMAGVYGARGDWTPQFVYILKPLGAFMLVLGGLGVVATLDPLRYSLIVYGFIAVLLVRDLQRLVYQPEIQEAFGVSPAWNLATGGYFFAQAAVMFVLLQLARKRSPATERP
jgi:hypothetical protein